MRGGISVVVEGTTVVSLETAPPLAAKVLDGPVLDGRALAGPVLVVVGSAAGLLEGDRVFLRVSLGPGARLTVITTAATIAHPCPGSGSTALEVECHLGPDARLTWLPEPLIACGGCRHISRSRLWLASGAAAVWLEACTLGRTGEEPGSVEQRFDVELEGRPLLRESLGVAVGPAVPAGPGPGVGLGVGLGSGLGPAGSWGGPAVLSPAGSWGGPAVLGRARHLASLHLLGRRLDADVPGVMTLAGPGATARMVANRAEELARRLAVIEPIFLNTLQPAKEAPVHA